MKVTTRTRHFHKTLIVLLTTLAITAISLTHYHLNLRQPPPQAFSLHEERDTSGYSAAERLMKEGILSGACEGWEPPSERNETSRVRSGCWKDQWHQQLSHVLDNWEDEGFSELSFAGNLNKDNHVALQKLLHCLPHYSLPISPDAPEECQHQNALTVVLSAHWWTDMARGNGEPSGEVVHLRPIMQALDRAHYTILTIYHKDYAGLVKIASALPDVITTIWAEDRLVVSCMADPRCRSDFPQDEKDRLGLSHVKGPIPAWKMVIPTYWALMPKSDWEWGQQPGDNFTFNTLSHDWILSPYAYPGHHHIPFSLEDSCESIPVIRASERKDQAVILGKLTKYYQPDRMWGIAPPPEVWLDFRERTGITPIGNAKSDIPTETVPPGVINQGPLPFENYTSEVGHSKMMIALGFPVISPSPYVALCQGVPVLLPYRGDTPTPDGWDLYKADYTQHGPAALIGEPYVYSYNLENMTSFYEAVEKAKNNPIEPYFPEEMRLTNINRLTLQLVNRDAQAMAREIEEARRQRGEPPHRLVPEYVLKQVYKNGWGTRLRANGTVSKVYGEED